MLAPTIFWKWGMHRAVKVAKSLFLLCLEMRKSGTLLTGITGLLSDSQR